MPDEIATVDTFEQEQTGRIHITKVTVPTADGAMYQCYCSFTRNFDPTSRELDLADERVCSTCAQGYLNDPQTDTSDEITLTA